MNKNVFTQIYYNELNKVLEEYDLTPHHVYINLKENKTNYFSPMINFYEDWFDFMHNKYPEYFWFFNKMQLEMHCEDFNTIDEIREFLNDLVIFYEREGLIKKK